MIVISNNYSKYYDLVSGLQFDPIEDMETGCMIGYARVSDDVAETMRSRPGFSLMPDAIFALKTSVQAVEGEDSATGDPLADAALKADNTPAPAKLEGQNAPAALPVKSALAPEKPADKGNAAALDGPPAPPKSK